MKKIVLIAAPAGLMLNAAHGRGQEVAVFHHPCGKREVTNPGAKRQSCPDCERLFLATPATSA